MQQKPVSKPGMMMTPVQHWLLTQPSRAVAKKRVDFIKNLRHSQADGRHDQTFMERIRNPSGGMFPGRRIQM